MSAKEGLRLRIAKTQVEELKSDRALGENEVLLSLEGREIWV